MRFALIGGSGGLGSILADHLLVHGHGVRCWSRSAERSLDVLDPHPPDDAFDADHVVYLAWSTTDRSPRVQGQHADAAVRWSRTAKERGVPFVFASTVLASRSAGSEYGRAKFLAEQGIRDHDGRNVRVGLVIDDGYPELLASRLRGLAKRAPWASRIGSWPVLPIAGETAARILVEECLSGASRAVPVLAAERSPIPLATIMSGESQTSGAHWASRALTGLAGRYPTSRGTIGRHVDALRGLALAEPDLEGVRDPISGRVPAEDWRRGIFANVSG